MRTTSSTATSSRATSSSSPTRGSARRFVFSTWAPAQTTYQRDSSARFAEGQAIGSPGYTSPELARGKPGDERSDVFSLAAVVYEMLAGVPAIHIEQSSSERLLRYVLTDRAPLPTHALSRVNPEFPTQLDAVFARGLERRPRRRYATVPAFQSALVDALALLSGDSSDDGMLGRLREILEKPLW